MEKLTDVQRQRVTKMSDARIVQKLLQVGMQLEKLEQMDRSALLAAMADIVAAGKEPIAAAVATVPQGAYDVELEKLKFEWQKQCYEREMQEKQELLRIEQQKLEAQQCVEQQNLELKKIEAEQRAEQQKLEWEEKKAMLELQAKREDQDRQERAWKAKIDDEREEERKRSSAARAKVFGDAMRNASVRMGSDPIEAIPFFESVEHLFDVFKVPDKLKVDLMRPYLWNVR